MMLICVWLSCMLLITDFIESLIERKRESEGNASDHPIASNSLLCSSAAISNLLLVFERHEWTEDGVANNVTKCRGSDDGHIVRHPSLKTITSDLLPSLSYCQCMDNVLRLFISHLRRKKVE